MDFPRLFLAHTTGGQTWQGCQFAIRYVVIMPPDTTGPDGPWLGTTLEALTEDAPDHPLYGARIEWADETETTR